MATTSPNILLILSDEHRADLAGFAGNPVVRTPNLDRLARRGTSFDAAYTPSPICVPARPCIHAGQLPTTCGCTGWKGLPAGYQTFPRVFHDYGYHTAAAGKLHLMHDDPTGGWNRILTHVPQPPAPRTRDRFPANNGGLPHPYSWDGGTKPGDLQELLEAGPGRSGITLHDAAAVDALRHEIDLRFAGDVHREKDRQRPNLLYLGLVSPHYAYRAEPDLIRYYEERVRFYEPMGAVDHPWLGTSPWWTGPLQTGVEVETDIARRALATYYAMTEMMDRDVGKVLDKLEAVGQDLDDWIVIYASDHGDMAGQHGLWEKQKFFDAAPASPLTITWPNGGVAQGRHVDQCVNLTDLFATLTDLAGFDDFDTSGLDSRSLRPLLFDDGDASSWHDEAVSQFFRNRGPTLAEPLASCMVRQGKLKLMHHGEAAGDWLVDLATPEGEAANRLGDPAYAEAAGRLYERVGSFGFDVGDAARGR